MQYQAGNGAGTPSSTSTVYFHKLHGPRGSDASVLVARAALAELDAMVEHVAGGRGGGAAALAGLAAEASRGAQQPVLPQSAPPLLASALHSAATGSPLGTEGHVPRSGGATAAAREKVFGSPIPDSEQQAPTKSEPRPTGVHVCVTTAFHSINPANQRRIEVGETGYIAKVHASGRVLIRFDGQANGDWVRKEDFTKVTMVEVRFVDKGPQTAEARTAPQAEPSGSYSSCLKCCPSSSCANKIEGDFVYHSWCSQEGDFPMEVVDVEGMMEHAAKNSPGQREGMLERTHSRQREGLLAKDPETTSRQRPT